ncbi:MAG: FxsA family protein [Paracoccaceae bacterium]
MWLFVLLVVVPIVEIALFIEVGGWIGLWPTLAVVVGTAILGAALLRAQGRGVLNELQARMDRGEDPRGPIAHGALIVGAGALMLTPGFFTDAVGFLLLVPPVRSAVIAWGAARLAGRVRGAVFVAGARPGPGPRGPRPGGDVVEGEYEALDEDEDEERGETAERGDRPGAPRAGESGWTRP